MADAFRTQVLQNNEASATPVVTLGSCSFLYTREVRRLWFCTVLPRTWRARAHIGCLQNNVYVLVITHGNTNAAAAFRFMQQVLRCRTGQRVVLARPSAGPAS